MLNQKSGRSAGFYNVVNINETYLEPVGDSDIY
jgi:hypothetical protein